MLILAAGGLSTSLGGIMSSTLLIYCPKLPLQRKYSTESLAIFREYEMQWAIGFALNNLAYAAYMEGDITQAFTLANESVSLFRGIDRGTGMVETLVTLGYVLLAQGEMAAVDEALSEVLRLALVHGPRLFMASALEGQV